MKNFVGIYAALVLALIVLLTGTGYACPETETTDGYIAYADPTFWAQDSETLEICGMLRPDEQVRTLPLRELSGRRMRGFLPGGAAIRVAAKVKVMCDGDQLLGVARLTNTRILIRADRLALVESIQERELGEEMEVCGGSVSFLILHKMEDKTVSERLATQYTGWIHIGWAHFNIDLESPENDTFEIVAYDWDGDGELDLCLVAGSAPEEKKPEPEPEPEPEKEREQEDKVCEREEKTGQTTTAAAPANNRACIKWEFDWHSLFQICWPVFGK